MSKNDECTASFASKERIMLPTGQQKRDKKERKEGTAMLNDENNGWRWERGCERAVAVPMLRCYTYGEIL
jgi:hypothetical protein